MSTSKYDEDVLERRGVSVLIGRQCVSFTLEAKRAKGLRVATTNESEKVELRLSFGSPHSRTPAQKFWEDNAANKIENRLTDIVIECLVTAERNYRASIIRSRDWLIGQKQEVRDEIQRRKEKREKKVRELKEQAERNRIEALLDQANNLQKAGTIRSYVQAIRGHAEQLSVPAEDLEKWAAWAESEADRIDPLKSLSFLSLMAESANFAEMALDGDADCSEGECD